MIKEKYNLLPHSGLESCVNRNDTSHFMKSICSVQKESWWSSNFSSRAFSWKIGNGKLVYFWEDIWILQRPLAAVFPRLYRLLNFPNSTVEEMVKKWKSLEDCVWKRSLRTWEKNQLKEIFSLIQQISLEERHDSIKWSASPQSYSSKKGYSTIMGLDNSGVDEWRKIRTYRVPPKILIFMWKFFYEVLPIKK